MCVYKTVLLVLVCVFSSWGRGDSLGVSIVPAAIAPLEMGLTLAQTPGEGKPQLDTLLVLEERGGKLWAVNVSEHFDLRLEDPLDMVAEIGFTTLQKFAASAPRRSYDYSDLRVSRVLGRRHIAAGTNYKAHQEETDLHSGFLFPKIASPSSFDSRVKISSTVLMDYEVELCVRFQAPIFNVWNFEEAIKGFFLCGDMSDRAELLRKINTDNPASGIGFTDAKSGDDRFPVGPFTVVPLDWRQFVNSVSLYTQVNGEQRQFSSADKMVKKIDEIVIDILKTGKNPSWEYQDKPLSLIKGDYIARDSAILTGTPEGVVYNGINTWSKILWGTQWVLSLSFLEGSVVQYVIEQTIAEGFDSGRYLQAGDQVLLGGTYLGRIVLEVVE
ncbi:fumarylacetoacetate hydrolase family protein [Pseudoteredinibacter isoporae]|uniref:2-keto-4-pentenoate hydratase/2-oxohepta-3-ene-1,7-dioic acid hydratase in catechol pathway n=1 Tax=Pseudoteredinibacter isoporae TaxID=570281 RepID=A0A7X0JXJ3_9GAMM|nr:fumarylacetoacetate hydrolase family protein [Pseudoteredinibacter isoporae]MBB6523256.1 2-keto-4-pentenoate hydratase/2-oxohepta-3-ene-1,7-dioic acid hydratase in catechol pathway [Pseudoteredinibacter isoporae]NHO88772.1 fumarylacetoacetate hydrolase [Pseudoteredinibacter isoporae]NIB22537.1 fumarylacetoacetate hydrolase [Pseudoteredinibacter isoporae]